VRRGRSPAYRPACRNETGNLLAGKGSFKIRFRHVFGNRSLSTRKWLRRGDFDPAEVLNKGKSNEKRFGEMATKQPTLESLPEVAPSMEFVSGQF